MITSPDWEEITLGDIARIKHGYAFKSEHFSEHEEGTPIVVNIGNFRYSGGFRFEDTALKGYSGEYPEEFVLKPNDILLIMTCQTAGGEILGIPGKIPDDGRRYLHNQRMGKVEITDPTRVHQGFLYWLFLSRDFNRHLVATASGTKILHTAPNRIESYRFKLPPYHEQQSIAEILEAVEDRIAANDRVNQVLRSIAHAIFKSWFIDFDPVSARAEGRKPFGMDDEMAALFPDSFEDSELGEIPKGWRVTHIGDLIDVYDSIRVPLSSRERQGRKGAYPYYGAAGIIDHVDDYLFDGVHILVGEDGSVVNDDGTPVLQYVWGRFWVNNHAHVLRGRMPISNEYLLNQLKTVNILPFVTGAVQPKLNQSNLQSVPVVRPSDELVRRYCELASPLYDLARSRCCESDTLASLRNVLLPKLLSGGIRIATDLIKDIEQGKVVAQ